MKIHELYESEPEDLPIPENVKGMTETIDVIAKFLFNGHHASPVKDAKRSKDAIFYGVAHKKSILTDPDGKSIYLTFDNSTDSGEFEINSLVPMRVEKGSAQDKQILALYRKHGVRSKKKTNYIAVGDKIYLREVHVGHEIDGAVAKLVRHLVRILSNQTEEEPEETPEKKSEK